MVEKGDKGSNSTGDKARFLELFLKIGLDERTANNTIANNKVTSNLTAVIHEVSLSNLACNFLVLELCGIALSLGFCGFFID